MKAYSTESPELWEVRDALMWSVLPLVSKLKEALAFIFSALMYGVMLLAQQIPGKLVHATPANLLTCVLSTVTLPFMSE